MFNYRRKINVTIDGKSITMNSGESILYGLMSNSKLFEDTRNVLAVKVNNEIHSLYYSLMEDSCCKTIDYYSEEGERIYARSLKYFFLMAFHRVCPQAKIEFTNKMGRDYYVKISNVDVDYKFLQLIKKEMNNIIKSKYPVRKFKVNFETAKLIYKEMNSIEQLENFKIKIKENYTFYECNGYYNYLYGLIVPNSSYIKGFDIRRHKEGVVLILPDKDNIEEVTSHIKKSVIWNEFDKFKKFSYGIGINNVADINSHVLDGSIGQIIRYCEADHNRRLFEVVENIAKKNNIKVIFISGPSSSGKTTFSQKLEIHLKIVGKNSIPLAMDNYFKDDEEVPIKADGSKDYESIENIDMELFKRQITDMINGKTVEVPEYNFTTSKKEYKGRKIKMEESDILIIEGIHALNPVVSDFILKENVYKIYLAPLVTLGLDNYTKVSSNDTRLIRRLVRDNDARGRVAQGTLAIWESVRNGEEKNIFPFVSYADYIYNTSLIYELGVLKPFAENLLLKVSEESPYYSDARRLYKLLSNFRTIETTEIPMDSIVKEFVGKGCFYR